MGWLNGLVVYIMIWWTTLFAVLPWGNAPAGQHEEGMSGGAPEQPRLRQKFLITTLISALIWGLVWLIVKSGIVDFYEWAEQVESMQKVQTGDS